MKNRLDSIIEKNTVANCRIRFDRKIVDCFVNGKKTEYGDPNDTLNKIYSEDVLKMILSIEMNECPLILHVKRLYAIFDAKPKENLPVYNINVSSLFNTIELLDKTEQGYLGDLEGDLAKNLGLADSIVRVYNKNSLELNRIIGFI